MCPIMVVNQPGIVSWLLFLFFFVFWFIYLIFFWFQFYYFVALLALVWYLLLLKDLNCQSNKTDHYNNLSISRVFTNVLRIWLSPPLCKNNKKIWKVNQTRNLELQAYTIGLCCLCYIIIIVVVDDASVIDATTGVVMVIMLVVVKDKVGVSNKCEWEE